MTQKDFGNHAPLPQSQSLIAAIKCLGEHHVLPPVHQYDHGLRVLSGSISKFYSKSAKPGTKKRALIKALGHQQYLLREILADEILRSIDLSSEDVDPASWTNHYQAYEAYRSSNPVHEEALKSCAKSRAERIMKDMLNESSERWLLVAFNHVASTDFGIHAFEGQVLPSGDELDFEKLVVSGSSEGKAS
jgi:hypothetical protein